MHELDDLDSDHEDGPFANAPADPFRPDKSASWRERLAWWWECGTTTPHGFAWSLLERDEQRRADEAVAAGRCDAFAGDPNSFAKYRHTQVALSVANPPQRWTAVAEFVASRPLRRVKTSADRAVQRTRRGWDDSMLVRIDQHTCATLADQFDAMAASIEFIPGVCDPAEAERVDELRAHAANLRAYAKPPVRVGADASAQRLAEEQRVRGAQEALRWFATNLVSLWE